MALVPRRMYYYNYQASIAIISWFATILIKDWQASNGNILMLRIECGVTPPT